MFKTCGKCGAYSRSLGQCKFGRVNPRTMKGTKEALLFYGTPSTICDLNRYKVKVMRSLLEERGRI